MFSKLNQFKKVILALSAVVIVTELVLLAAGYSSGHDAFMIIVAAALPAGTILADARMKQKK